MKIISYVAIFTLLFTVIAFTQDDNKPELSIGGGLSLPSKPEIFSDYWKMGFNFGGGFAFPFTPSLSFITIVDYSRFAFDEEKLLENFGFLGYGIEIKVGSASIVTVTENLKASFNPGSNAISPYFIGGMGLFSVSTSEVKVSVPSYGISETIKGQSESAFALQFGFGIDIPTDETTKIFIECKYCIGFTEEESTHFFPIRAGASFKL